VCTIKKHLKKGKIFPVHTMQAMPTRGRGSQYKLLVFGRPEGGPGPKYIAYILFVSVATFVKINHFSPSPSHPATDSNSDLV
jgi:hypothetical protein